MENKEQKVEEIKKKMHSEQILKELFAEIGDCLLYTSDAADD